ncbi:chromosomal replication initiator protein DnaA [Desulforhopalus vacuolatus]|uniref:chromosomal replication initiator protein DnaA n=1 Tax=Desulforhopalus vacuolatus TaxID=40414 RepID=UPI0019623183|nr:chromosomal replication initiator protein DnaA [Desulforhopalus vacuolatus]MBM9518435.1 chromosomal replication initiator protein DnaA [Desulforhopalus vacuolatus]
MVWKKIQQGLRSRVSESIYQLWLEPLSFTSFDGRRLVLESPDKFISAYVERHFAAVVKSLLAEAGVKNGELVLREAVHRAAPKKSTSPYQKRLPLVPENNSRLRSLNPKYTFDQFMVGESNMMAESACESMTDGDSLAGICLYLHSATGLGKSHLTHAVAHKIWMESPLTRLHYLTAKQFAAEMVRGIHNRTMDDFKAKYMDNCDILLVEDIHTLTGKNKTQEELNDVLDSLIKSGKRVVFTSNAAPRDLKDIDSEFCSRMTSGIVTPMKAPDTSTRCAIIEKKAGLENLILDADSVDYLGTHIRGDVRRIESALRSLKMMTRMSRGGVNVEMVRSVVAQVVGYTESVLTAPMISELVSSQFKVSVEALQSKSRKRNVCVPRQVAMYLARKHTEESLVNIGRCFNRDHSTVMHSIKVVTDRVRRDTAVNAQVQMLSDKVTQM